VAFLVVVHNGESGRAEEPRQVAEKGMATVVLNGLRLAFEEV
jgi:hypothetical protein